MRCIQVACAAIFLCLLGLPSWAAEKPEAKKPSFEEYLRESAVSKGVIDRFLKGPSWAQYDPELGYILGKYLPQDGMDNSATISTVQANGARTSFMYAGKKCRINTYLRAGGRPTRWFVQSWYPHPKQMLPETAPHSMTALLKAVIERVRGTTSASEATPRAEERGQTPGQHDGQLADDNSPGDDPTPVGHMPQP